MKSTLLPLLFCLLITGQVNAQNNQTSRVTITVDMSDEEVVGDSVFIIGNFFFGRPEFLFNVGNNIWEYTITFTRGDSLFYRFSNGNELETLTDGDCLTADNERRLLVVPDQDTVIVPTVCFGTCGTCENVVSSIPKLDVSDLEVFPNPMRDYTVVDWRETDLTLQNIQLVNLQGQVITTFNELTARQIQLPKGDLAAGMYWIRMTDMSGKVGSRKLVIK